MPREVNFLLIFGELVIRDNKSVLKMLTNTFLSWGESWDDANRIASDLVYSKYSNEELVKLNSTLAAQAKLILGEQAALNLVANRKTHKAKVKPKSYQRFSEFG